MPRQERYEMGGNSDWSYPRTAAAVRNTEGFVQIQVTDICPEIPWTAYSHLSIHICPIHVYLPTVGMDDRANIFNLLLEYTMS